MNFYSNRLILCFVPILIGCSASQEEKSNIPDQVRNLENLTAYQRTEIPDTLILHREQEFGNTDSILIGRIHDIGIDSSGRVFIGDIQKQVIYIFNSNGRFLGQLGRSGKGSGEFTTLREVQIRNNDLYAYDPNQQKLSIFSIDSLAVANTIFLAENRGNHPALHRAFPRIDNVYIRNNHTYIAEFIIHPSSVDFKPWENVEYKSLFYQLNKTGNISSKKLLEIDQTYTNVGGLIDNIKVFFGRPMIVLANNNNIYVSDESDLFLIKIYDPNGAYLRAFYYPHPNIPLTQKSASKGGITGTHFRKDFLIKNMESMNLPRNWPVLTDMKIDDQDRLWIATTVEDMKVYEWWVLNSDGKLFARFNWPRSKPIQLIKNGYLYTREFEEETGLQQIVRYCFEVD